MRGWEEGGEVGGDRGMEIECEIGGGADTWEKGYSSYLEAQRWTGMFQAFQNAPIVCAFHQSL